MSGRAAVPRRVLLAVVGPTAGRWYIDVASGVTPKQFIRGEWFVTIAAFTGAVWIVVDWPSSGAQHLVAPGSRSSPGTSRA